MKIFMPMFRSCAQLLLEANSSKPDSIPMMSNKYSFSTSDGSLEHPDPCPSHFGCNGCYAGLRRLTYLMTFGLICTFLSSQQCLGFQEIEDQKRIQDGIASQESLPEDGQGIGQNNGQGRQNWDKLDLVLLLDVPSVFPPETYTKKIERAISSNPDLLGADRISIRRKSAVEFDLLRRFIENPEQFTDTDNFIPVIEAMDGTRWRINIDRPSDQFVGMEVRFLEDGREQVKLLGVSDPADREKDPEEHRLIYNRNEIGSYQFYSKPSWELKDYSLVYLDGDKESRTSPIAWPSARARYLLRISGFSGGVEGKEALFEALSRKEEANPFQFLADSKPVMFSNVNIDDAVLGATTGWSDDIFTVRMPPLGKVQAQQTRVWLCFPLSKEKIRQIQEQLTGMNYEAEALIDEINSGNMISVSRNVPDVQVSLEPSAKPTWFELSPINDPNGELSHFERQFRVKNISGWMDYFRSDSSVYGLVVYEGKDFGKSVAIVVNSNDQPSLLLEHEMGHWYTGIRNLHNEQTQGRE
jgi:hypothetical protein